MKKSIFSLFVVLGLSFCLYSCEKQDGGDTDGDTPKEEYIELGLMPKGIDFSITPMSNRASSSDMYSVVVLRGEDQPYATWTTNDLTSEKFKLIKGDRYRFFVMYIPDGQNILEGVGYSPFFGIHAECPGLNDGICYGANYYNQSGLYGRVCKKGDKPSASYEWGYHLNDVDRYHGFVEVNATASVTLNVDLYRQMFGFDVVANNFKEGTIKIIPPMNNNSGNNEIILTPSNYSVSKILELIEMPWWGSITDFSEDCCKNFVSGLYFSVDYIDKDGKSMTILNYDKPIKRMTKLTMTLDVAAILEDIQAGLNPNVVTGEEWTEERFDY